MTNLEVTTTLSGSNKPLKQLLKRQPNTVNLPNIFLLFKLILADCIHGFRQVGDDIDPSSIKKGGRFGGYFIDDSECRQQCEDIRSIKCAGFMFEPESAGKCTLYTNIFNGYDSEDDSTASLWFIC
jgi:hypothetical protein